MMHVMRNHAFTTYIYIQQEKIYRQNIRNQAKEVEKNRVPKNAVSIVASPFIVAKNPVTRNASESMSKKLKAFAILMRIKQTHETNNARIDWRDYRNVRIIRIHLRNSDLLHQQQPAVTKSNTKKTTSQQTKVKSSVHVHVKHVILTF